MMGDCNLHISQAIPEKLLTGTIKTQLMQTNRGKLEIFIRGNRAQKASFPVDFMKYISDDMDEDELLETGMRYSALKTFVHLLSNAVRRMPHMEYGTLCVSFQVEQEGSCVVMTDIAFVIEEHWK